MALDDKDIFQAICERYKDQPIEFIMAEYEKARRINMEIEQRAAPVFQQYVSLSQDQTMEDARYSEEAEQPKKKYSRRNFVVKAQDAITEDAIYCCICGAQRQTLTSRHLAMHGLSVEDYKKLCGYPQEQALMSGKRLVKSKEIIARAQQARLDKKSAMEDN